MTKMDELDEKIHKYLYKKATQKEKDWLLDQLLKYFNELLRIKRVYKNLGGNMKIAIGEIQCTCPKCGHEFTEEIEPPEPEGPDI